MSRRAASPALTRARTAVRRSVADLPPGASLLVGCSGGPDSLALAGTAGWVAARVGLSVTVLVVDHDLQPGSAEVADGAARACGALGLRAEVVRVRVGRAGGPEAAARDARQEALRRAAADAGASAVLLGHTLDDQAETVLLRLARGSGARSLSAMAPVAGLWRRPFLALPRAEIHEVAEELLAPLGLVAWADPHNASRDFARVRVRTLLGDLGADLGPGVVGGLARSADLLRADADALDALAEEAAGRLLVREGDGLEASCDDLAALPAAIRGRVIRRACLLLGSPGDGLGHAHVRRVDALVTDWHGQGEIRLPGGVVARRACGRLTLHPR